MSEEIKKNLNWEQVKPLLNQEIIDYQNSFKSDEKHWTNADLKEAFSAGMHYEYESEKSTWGHKMHSPNFDLWFEKKLWTKNNAI